MTDLHGWITQQIDQREEAANDATGDHWFAEHPDETWGEQNDAHLISDGKCVATLRYDRNGHLNADHIALNDPAAVLRRCEADRRILDRHRLATEWTWAYDEPCHGCGVMGDCDDPVTDHLNDCPELLDLAHAHGITAEILAGLDKPQMPPRPTTKLRGHEPDTSRVPAALRGPNWKDAP